MGDEVAPFDVDGQWVDVVAAGVEHLLGGVSREHFADLVVDGQLIIFHFCRPAQDILNRYSLFRLTVFEGQVLPALDPVGGVR